MGGGGDLRDVGQHRDVVRTVVERVIPDQEAIRLATQGAVLVLVDTAEDRAVVPGIPAELAQRAVQLAFADVQHLDAAPGIAVGSGNEHMQPAPACLHRLEIGMMDDGVHHRDDSLVDARDQCRDQPARRSAWVAQPLPDQPRQGVQPILRRRLVLRARRGRHDIVPLQQFGKDQTVFRCGHGRISSTRSFRHSRTSSLPLAGTSWPTLRWKSSRR